MQLQLPGMNVPPLARQRSTKNGSQGAGTLRFWLKVQSRNAWVLTGQQKWTAASTGYFNYFNGLGVPGKLLHDFRRTAERPGSSSSQVVENRERQDLGVPELRFLAALAPERPNALFFAGVPWPTHPAAVLLEVARHVRGRSYTLRVNYRTSQRRTRSRRGRPLDPPL